MIADQDISVIVQGPYSPHTDVCMESVKRFLPGAEIILSTWEGSRLSEKAGVLANKVVFNNDPGTLPKSTASRTEPFGFISKNENLNRQLASTQGGLRSAARTWSLKIRSDLALTDTGFLQEAIAQGLDKTTGAGARIVTTDVMSPDRSAMLFFVQDFAYFGKTCDLVRLHEVPFASIDGQNWTVEDIAGRFLIYSEQYIWYHYFLKTGRPCISHAWDKTPHAVEESRRFYCEKTIPLSFMQFGVEIQKYPEWKKFLYLPLSMNWLLRASYGEWKRWSGQTAEDEEVNKKMHVHDLYRRFLREKVGQELPLHFEINVANNHIERAFADWLKSTAAC